MSAGAWVLVSYFGIGWVVATFLWVVLARDSARSEGWGLMDWVWWILPMLSVPGFILTLFWPITLLEWVTSKGGGRHIA